MQLKRRVGSGRRFACQLGIGEALANDLADKVAESVCIAHGQAIIEAKSLFGSYRRALGWRRGKPGGTDKDPTFRLRIAPR